MGVALRLYKGLTDAGEDKSRAQVIADAFEELESRYPDLKEMATQGHVRESELRLQKEIKEVEARLQKEIKGVELKIREVETRLQIEIREVETKLTQAIHRQTVWVIVAIASMTGVLRWLDVVLR